MWPYQRRRPARAKMRASKVFSSFLLIGSGQVKRQRPSPAPAVFVTVHQFLLVRKLQSLPSLRPELVNSDGSVHGCLGQAANDRERWMFPGHSQGLQKFQDGIVIRSRYLV